MTRRRTVARLGLALLLAFSVSRIHGQTRVAGNVSGSALPLLAAAIQTQTVCGSLPPAGWITTSITGVCRQTGGASYMGRVISRIDNLPSNSSLNVCGDVPPAGWVSTAVAATPCFQFQGASYMGRTIRRIDGLPVNSSVTICGGSGSTQTGQALDPPAGWVVTAVAAKPCAVFQNASYIQSTILRIDTLPVRSSVKLCGGLPPTGWVVTAVSSTPCATYLNVAFMGSTILRIDTLPANSSVSVCGGSGNTKTGQVLDPPAGWVTTAVSSTPCATFQNAAYLGSTILKIDGMPVGSSVNICGGLPPSGWVATKVDPQPCARFSNLSFQGRTIKRLQ